MPVPEATVNEDDLATPRECQVGCAGNVPGMQPIPVAHRVHKATNRPLRTRVLASYERHDFASSFSRNGVHGAPCEFVTLGPYPPRLSLHRPTERVRKPGLNLKCRWLRQNVISLVCPHVPDFRHPMALSRSGNLGCNAPCCELNQCPIWGRTFAPQRSARRTNAQGRAPIRAAPRRCAEAALSGSGCGSACFADARAAHPALARAYLAGIGAALARELAIAPVALAGGWIHRFTLRVLQSGLLVPRPHSSAPQSRAPAPRSGLLAPRSGSMRPLRWRLR